MAGTPTDPHDNLAAGYPGAASVRCDGLGYVEVFDAEGNMRAGKCPACQRIKLAGRVGGFIPPRFAARIDLPPEVDEWVALGDKAQGLYLAGPVGTGKTHAAWEALGRWCMVTGAFPSGPRAADYGPQTPSVIFTRMTDLLDDLRPGDGARQRIRDCQSTRLLVVDDLGAEKPSEWTQERFYSVIDHRYANCLPLIVTGNLPPSKLAEQTGDRAASRLAEMCVVVPMTGADRRRAA